MEKVEIENKKVGSDASQNQTNDMVEEKQDSKKLCEVGNKDKVVDKRILSQSMEEQESSQQEMEKVESEDKEVGSDASQNQTNDMEEELKQDLKKLCEVGNEDTVVDKSILSQSMEVQESSQQGSEKQNEKNSQEIDELIVQLDKTIESKSLENQQYNQQETESKHSQPLVYTHTQPQVQQYQYNIWADPGQLHHSYPMQVGMSQSWHPSNLSGSSWVSLPQPAQAQVSVSPFYPVVGYPRAGAPTSYYAPVQNYAMYSTSYIPPLEVRPPYQIEVPSLVQARAPNQTPAIGYYPQHGRLQSKKELTSSSWIKKQKAPGAVASFMPSSWRSKVTSSRPVTRSSSATVVNSPTTVITATAQPVPDISSLEQFPLMSQPRSKHAAEATQDDTKSGDVKEHNIAREIYDVVKKYMDPDSNNNSKPEAKSDSPDKQVKGKKKSKASLKAEQTKKDYKEVQSGEHNNDKDTTESLQHNETREELIGFVTKTCYEELNARLASLDGENQELKRLIADLMTRLDALESASVKSASSQAELEMRLDILDVAATKFSHYDSKLKERIESFNQTCSEIIRVVRALEVRLEALELVNVESRLTTNSLSTRLSNLESMVIEISLHHSLPHEKKSENSPGEDIWKGNSSLYHPYSQEASYKGLQSKPDDDFVLGKESPLMIHSYEEEVVASESSEEEEEATSVNIKETIDASTEPTDTLEYDDWTDERYDAWYTSIVKRFKADMEKTDKKVENRLQYNRETLLELSCQPMSLKKPKNLPSKLCKKRNKK